MDTNCGSRPPNPAPAVEPRGHSIPGDGPPLSPDRGAPFSIITSNVPIVTPRDTTRAIIREVAERHGVTYRDIIDYDRHGRVMAARHEAILAVRQAKPHMSLPDLGRVFQRDHSTILSSLDRSAKRMPPPQQDAAE